MGPPWSLARIEMNDGPLRHAIAASSRRRISEVRRFVRATIAWSFSPLAFEHRPCWDSISSSAIRKISAASAMDIEKTSWACARLTVSSDSPLSDALSASAIRTISECGPSDIQGMAWSLSTLLNEDMTLLTSIASAALRRLSDWAIYGMNRAGFAWALSTWRCNNWPLWDSLAASSLRNFQAVQLSILAWSVAVLEWLDATLRHAISSSAIPR